MKTETTILLKESPASTGNATTGVKEVIGTLILGGRNEKIKTMTSKNYSREQHYVEKFKKRTIKKILKKIIGRHWDV